MANGLGVVICNDLVRVVSRDENGGYNNYNDDIWVFRNVGISFCLIKCCQML